jgi:hypothetical protein
MYLKTVVQYFTSLGTEHYREGMLKKLHSQSPQANYTDQATAASRQS